MDFRAALTTGSLIKQQAQQPATQPVPAIPTKSAAPSRPGPIMYARDVGSDNAHVQESVEKSHVAKSHWVAAPQHPILGIPTAFLETEEISNTILFIATGVFILYMSDAFVKLGRRRARADAIVELLRSQNVGSGSSM